MFLVIFSANTDFLLTDRRKAVTFAIWQGLFWVAFLNLSLQRRQAASGKGGLFYLPLTEQVSFKAKLLKKNR
jgi:hypothetical protein